MRRVVTLDNERFRQACRQLANIVVDGGDGFRPDLIIGIRTGGEYVARAMQKSLPDVPVETVELHRPMTEGKKGFSGWLRRLPRPMLDAMRIGESWLLSVLPHRKSSPAVISEELGKQIATARSILVVDDACDSGVTLRSVVDAIVDISDRHSRIRTGVLTLTTRHPVIIPDYILFAPRTLIRFPWSADMKEK